MQTKIQVKGGEVEVKAARRESDRWESEFRYVPAKGAATDWMPAYSPEGFMSEAMALTAAILLGRQIAEGIDSASRVPKR
ncbi:hypothetical protein [Ralstonia pickettii]|uniref:hypothetical protein n=1 Tax=Ralstonia pickettii TaxID=329 RepID=UPI0015C0DFDA|nr:hypothetical protein [Ralstonia pickettii]NWK44862.1 hypothetical protein [Ralstonia pickettii]